MLANLGYSWQSRYSWVLHSQNHTHTWTYWPHLHRCCSQDKRLPCTHQCWCHRSVQCSQGDSDRCSFLSLSQECTWLHLHREMTHRHWVVYWLLQSISKEDVVDYLWTFLVEIHRFYQTLHKQCSTFASLLHVQCMCTLYHVYVHHHRCRSRSSWSGFGWTTFSPIHYKNCMCAYYSRTTSKVLPTLLIMYIVLVYRYVYMYTCTVHVCSLYICTTGIIHMHCSLYIHCSLY